MAYSRSYTNRSNRSKWAPKPTETVKTRPTFTPSEYQVAILDWLRNGSGNCVVMATAGSGKTSLLELLAWDIKDRMPAASAVFLAFGRMIADELTKRLPFPASTFHSLCNAAVRKHVTQTMGLRIDPRNFLEKTKLDRMFEETYGKDAFEVASVVKRLVGLCKSEAYRPNVSDESIMALYDLHDLDYDSDDYSDRDVCNMVRAMLQASLKNVQTIDFDDMLWLVVMFDLRLDTFDYVMVDEAQDTNPVQRDIIRRLMHKNTRGVFVGDSAQAIYGFRGASNDALELIADEFLTTSLPLTVSYRCPRSVVEYASRFGVIEAAPNAIDGTVSRPKTWKLTDFRPNDLILCRNTAPLVQTCYRLISRRINAVIKGRDIGAGLVSLIKQVSGRTGTLETLPDRLEAYREREVKKAAQKRQETKIQSINDRVDSILMLIDSMTQDDVEMGLTGLYGIISEMFSDDARQNAVTLSTVHKSKGLEAQHVIILDDHLMPSKMAKQPWQMQQERNIQFVAYTRAKSAMTFVSSESIVLE